MTRKISWVSGDNIVVYFCEAVMAHPHVEEGGVLQMGATAANVLSKQFRTTDKRRFSKFERFPLGANSSKREKLTC
jgi:hypothetical protein